jgi:Uma2 family endonuclease
MSLAFAMPEESFDPGVKAPPSNLESDEPEMEGYLHLIQMLLLLETLELFWQHRNDFFAAGNLTIYFSPRQLKSEKFRGPDFFVVLGTEKKPRKSWTVWDEDGRYPNMIVEILSDSTAALDRGLKKQIYQDVFRTPDYFWFDPETLELAGFHLTDGRYEPLVPDAQGRLLSAQLGLLLGVHEGKLRFFTQEGALLPAAKEIAQAAAAAQQQAAAAQQQAAAAQQQAEAAQQQAEAAQQQAARLAAKLRELGVDPDTIK